MAVDAVDVCGELLDVAEHDRTRARQVDMDFLDHLAGARAHHQDAVRQTDRLLDAVRDEQHRGPAAQPQRFQVRPHLQARQAHRARRTARPSAAATDRAPACESATRAAACRRRAGADTCASRASSRSCANSSFARASILFRGNPRMSACSVTLSNAVRNSSSRWSWNAMPTSVIGLVTELPPTTMSPRLRFEQPRHHQHQRALAAARRARRPRRTRRPAMSTLTSFSAWNGLSVSSPKVFDTRLMRIGTPDLTSRPSSVSHRSAHAFVADALRRRGRERHLRHEQRLAAPLDDVVVLIDDLDVERRDRLRRPATCCRAARRCR